VRIMEAQCHGRAGQANGPFGRAVIEYLFQFGVAHFVVSPGSRSTPLALAVAGLPVRCGSVCLDERCAAFRALGHIRATGRPAAVVCTSGTAGAHYYPAVIEAREAGLPLVVLTADRPPELRHCHAGQTIDQLKLFGSYPLFHAELPLPEPDVRLLGQVRESCRHAIEAALSDPPGPVHLNIPFREPFFPEGGPSTWDPGPSGPECAVVPIRQQAGAWPELPERTLILAGPRSTGESEAELQALCRLSRKRCWPILADGSNPLRHGERGGTIVIHYDRLCRDSRRWEELQPQALVQWGEPPTSKVLRQRLAALDLPGVRIGGKPGLNPTQSRVARLPGTLTDLEAALPERPGSFGTDWREADAACEEALGKALAEPHPLFEGDLFRLLGRELPTNAALLLANSLAVRDAEWFLPRRADPLLPFSQRGANGIDGTLSTAHGLALGLGQPVYLVCGDLAFLHDSNGLLGLGSADPGVCVIMVNNAGGGIFESLPVAHEPAFESFFATPQRIHFRALVEAHGGSHRLCPGLPELAREIAGWDGRGLRVAEVPVDRKVSRDLHRRFLEG